MSKHPDPYYTYAHLTVIREAVFNPDAGDKGEYECPKAGCAWSHRWASRYSDHVIASHLYGDTWECPICTNKTYSKKGNLVKHVKIQHQSKSNPQKLQQLLRRINDVGPHLPPTVIFEKEHLANLRTQEYEQAQEHEQEQQQSQQLSSLDTAPTAFATAPTQIALGQLPVSPNVPFSALGSHMPNSPWIWPQQAASISHPSLNTSSFNHAPVRNPAAAFVSHSTPLVSPVEPSSQYPDPIIQHDLGITTGSVATSTLRGTLLGLTAIHQAGRTRFHGDQNV